MSPQLAIAAPDEPRPLAPSLRSHLGIVAEMLEALETQTNAGQRHTMGKVVGILSAQIARPSPVRVRFIPTIEELAHEASRPMPDAPVFRQRAERLVSALSGAI